MREVYLVRHAQAAAKEAGMLDFHRPLLPKGIEDAREAARRLAEKRVTLELLVSSPAIRALETAEIVAEELGYPRQAIPVRDILYDGSHGALFVNILRELDDTHNTVVLVGHQPLLSEFAHALTGEFNSAIPEAGVVGIELGYGDWCDLSFGSGTVTYVDFPHRRVEKTQRG